MLYLVEKIVKEPLEIEFGDIENPSEEVNKILNNLPSVNEISKEKVLIKSDAQTLFIIGNGFDLHHGLKTRYTDFKNYLLNNDLELLEALENNFGLDRNNDYLWNCFEDKLKHCTSIPYNQNVPVSKETAETKISTLIGQIFYIDLNLNQRIFDWISEIQQNEISSVLSCKEPILMSSDSLFLSYNYTTVLEDCYGISESRVHHIHGKFSKDNTQQLFVGFGDSNFDVLKNYHVVISEDFLDTPEDGKGNLEVSLKSKDLTLSKISNDECYRLLNFFTNRNKTDFLSDVNLYNFNVKILRKLNKVNKVIILGHSLGTSDVLSLKLLRDKLGDDVYWYLGVYSELPDNYVNNLAKIALFKLLLDQEHLSYFKW